MFRAVRLETQDSIRSLRHAQFVVSRAARGYVPKWLILISLMTSFAVQRSRDVPEN